MGIVKKQPAVFLGLGITLLFLALSFLRTDLTEGLELKFYDVRLNFREMPSDSKDIILVNIDDESVKREGNWPWSRSLLADGIEKIARGNPRLIGLNIILSEPQKDKGLEQLDSLIQYISQIDGANREKILHVMKAARENMDDDSKLEAALKKAGNVILPVVLKESRVVQTGTRETRPEIVRQSVQDVENAGGTENILHLDEIDLPIPRFSEAANGIGHVTLSYDPDGKVRRNALLYQYLDTYIPSFPLKLAAVSLDLSNSEIGATLGKSLRLGEDIEIPLTPRSEFLVSFLKPQKEGGSAFTTYSFFEVVNGTAPPDVFKEKIVLITLTATGFVNPLSTPASDNMSLGEYTANVIWSILNRHFIEEPSWNRAAGIGMIVLTGFLIMFVFPRLKAILAGLAFVFFSALLLGSSFYLFVSRGVWLKITYPFLQLVLGYIGVVTVSFFVTEVGKEKVEGESAETNRMLGLSFQSQGMLDMAFDKLRKVPVDDEMKEVLYNLALDYERKRQYNKAASVYEYIESHDPKYKNVAERKAKLLQASETLVFGDGFLGGGSTAGGDPLLATGSDTRPTLGRYEVIKQLGKGAMGVVYLGQDPRINRTTAIKTFRFTDDFEPEEAEKMKQKFFREAESAGTLSHPNIVTIYDAGDEHDLAYIAMEFLDGDDLQKYTKKKNLLPMRKVIDIVADIADGLDYAHERGIVHRDIKPANVMILRSGVVKITDFGIARITASSQTQTGVVKGTPHYMSPEQISGKKVDGRSDIFSLGTMLFQLLTGELPFRGDSPAALMHQIMNVRQPDPRKANPRLLKPLVTIIDKALEKDRRKRYGRASHMSNHLRALGKKIDDIIAQKKAQQNRS